MCKWAKIKTKKQIFKYLSPRSKKYNGKIPIHLIAKKQI